MEKWSPVAGFEELYEVSDHGRVRSLPRRVPYGTRGATMSRAGRIIAPFWVSNNDNRQGALAVSLGRGKRFRVSHLVLEAFVGPRPEGAIALHFDDNPANNHVSNLRWGTFSDNMYDSVRNRHHAGVLKETCRKGHPLDGLWKSGKRYCTTCRREYVRDYKKRKREGGPINPPGRPRKVSDG